MAKLGWLALGAVLSITVPTLAQAPMRSLDRCMAIADPAARLSCYDNALARPAPSPQPQPQSQSQPQSAEAARAAAPPSAPVPSRAAPPAVAQSAPPRPAPAPSIIDGRITAIVPIGDDLFRFQLSDGSVWRTGEQAQTRPQVGEAVRIRRSVLTSFASIGGRAAIGVRPAR